MILGFGWNELDALGSLLGGISTGGAFGTALVVLTREIRTRRKETSEREQERRDEERRQARLVYATIDPDASTESGYMPNPEFDDGERYSEVHVRVYNHSDAPIWDVKVPVAGREHRPLLIEHVAPRSSEGNGWLDAPESWHLMNIGAGCPGTPHWTPLDVIFVDNLGRRWRRSGRSEPVRLLDNEDLQSI
jgi:hypothetical protein